MRTITRRKNCSCPAPSSGPRAVARTTREGNSIILHLAWVTMACTACDEPWVEVREAETWEGTKTDGR